MSPNQWPSTPSGKTRFRKCSPPPKSRTTPSPKSQQRSGKIPSPRKPNRKLRIRSRNLAQSPRSTPFQNAEGRTLKSRLTPKSSKSSRADWFQAKSLSRRTISNAVSATKSRNYRHSEFFTAATRRFAGLASSASSGKTRAVPSAATRSSSSQKGSCASSFLRSSQLSASSAKPGSERILSELITINA